MTDRPWPADSWPTPEQYQEWLLALEPAAQLEQIRKIIDISILAATELDRAADNLEDGALIERSTLVKELHSMARAEFVTNGPLSPRGAALWDIATWLVESRKPTVAATGVTT